MKIAYFLELNPNTQKGVFRKIVSQVEAWEEIGHTVEIFMISPQKPEFIPKHNYHIVTGLSILKPAFLVRICRYLNRIISIHIVKNLIKSYHPDLIYYRTNIYYPGLLSVFSNAPVIAEVNSLAMQECKNWFTKIITFLSETLIYRALSGAVFVSYELQKAYSRKTQGKSIVIANGYQCLIKRTSLQKEKHVRPQLILVASPGMVWHGVDKFLDMASLLPAYDFHLVGPVIEEDNLPNNLIQHGYLSQRELFDLYQVVDIGVGSLALHRNKMNEASPLKVREYCCFRLPLILGYHDTDLGEQDFILNVGNYEKNIMDHTEEITQFVSEWCQKKIPEKALTLIDSFQKEKQRVRFFERLLKDHL